MFASRNSFLSGSGTKPNAPTVGTATATGTTTATVAYTAPAFDGGSPITSYTATSSPGGVTGTISQAGSGTITVSGLSAGITYTFTVTATNAIGTSNASSASNSITTVPVLGQTFQGGYYAGQISTTANSVATHYLIVSPRSTGDTSTYEYKTSNSATTGTSSVIDGATNSSNMNNASHPAAQFCEGLTTGGYSDWYMPAQFELEICYYNLKPQSAIFYENSTGVGTNAYSVPARTSNYTNTGPPNQTTVTAFQVGNSQAFEPQAYWSSTQGSAADEAWYLPFDNGNNITSLKSNSYYVRAVRKVAI
jgi:hypothetical protein